jgi:magnesium chelatase subunit I
MEWFTGARRLELSDGMTGDEALAVLRGVAGLEELARRLEPDGDAELAAAMEFVLEGLHQSSVLAKEETEARRVFLDMFQTMFSRLEER